MVLCDSKIEYVALIYFLTKTYSTDFQKCSTMDVVIIFINIPHFTVYGQVPRKGLYIHPFISYDHR